MRGACHAGQAPRDTLRASVYPPFTPMTLYLLMRTFQSKMSPGAKVALVGGILAAAAGAIYLFHEHEEHAR